MIVVIADDITGAAEMAGVAFDYGLRVRLVLGLDEGLPVADVVVVATDTRSMSASQAVAVTKEVMARLLMHAKERMPFPVLFKKTDSALRGHVMEELEAILASGPYKKAVFLPANPSRGRVIRDGKYYCGDVPISKTDFAFDPEFPALTDSMVARFPDAARLGVWMPDASSVGEIEAVVVRPCSFIVVILGRQCIRQWLLMRAIRWWWQAAPRASLPNWAFPWRRCPVRSMMALLVPRSGFTECSRSIYIHRGWFLPSLSAISREKRLRYDFARQWPMW